MINYKHGKFKPACCAAISQTVQHFHFILGVEPGRWVYSYGFVRRSTQQKSAPVLPILRVDCGPCFGDGVFVSPYRVYLKFPQGQPDEKAPSKSQLLSNCSTARLIVIYKKSAAYNMVLLSLTAVVLMSSLINYCLLYHHYTFLAPAYFSYPYMPACSKL